jgi:tetratricopeptide (TPR) repeat protein
MMNGRFISVKVQMNRTKSDNQVVKKWYAEAEAIQKQYKVSVFPTYLFFSPEGLIVHRGESYQNLEQFVSLASAAMDTKTQFYSLVHQYEQGIKDYEKMPYLISVAKKMNEFNLEQQLRMDYLAYLATLKKEELFAKEKLELIGSSIQGTKSIFFNLFYPDGRKVNAIMEQSGYARRITDSVIARELINPVLAKLSKNEEPNWQKLFGDIKNKFGAQYAERNILWKKVKWYDAKGDIHQYTKNFINIVKINGLDTSNRRFSDIWLNYVAYNNIFGGNPFVLCGSKDTAEINIAIQWMREVVRRAPKISQEWHATTLDTYAMLLYKAGRKQDALCYEEMALKIAIGLNAEDDRKEFESKISRMHKNEPTWRTN